MRIKNLAAALASSVSLVAFAVPAEAQQLQFNIPAGSLKSALDAYGRQSGRAILYKSEDIRGVRSPGYRGSAAVDAALDRILAGTGFGARRDASGAVAIIRAAAASGEAADERSTGAGQAGTVPQNRRGDEEIVVTGTNIRGVSPVGSKLITVDRDEIDRRGYEDAADIVRDQTQNFNGGPSNDGGTLNEGAANRGAGRNTTLGTSVNLRGLGSSSTLVLLDGQRLPVAGSDGSFTDISAIPVGAIERVEILPDGASALYGSDAVGGVVNYILRTDFRGAETRLRASVPTQGRRQIYTASQAFGLNWGSGRLLLSGQYQRQQRLSALDRDFSSSFDHRPKGGTDQRSPLSGVPGTITVGGANYAIPANPSNAAASTLPWVRNTANPRDVSEVDQLYPSERLYSGYAYAAQDITDWLSIKAQGLYSRRETSSITPTTATFTLRPANPFYYNPAGGTANISVSYNFTPLTGAAPRERATDFVAGTLGLTAKLGPDWEFRANGAYAGSWSHIQSQAINVAALNAAVASTNPATAFNPFGGPGANAALIDDIFSRQQINRMRSRTKSLFAVLDGSPFALGGRDVRVALGAEYRELDFRFVAQTLNQPFGADTGGVTQPRTRNVRSIFGELLLPLLGEPGAGPQRLDLSAAVRHERYSDFGTSTVPRFGVDFEIVPGFLFRAAYSRSFRAPDLTTLSGGENFVDLIAVNDPASPSGISQTLFFSGAVNTDLKPERARTFTFGVDLAPPALPEFRASANYFDIAYIDRLATIFSGVNINTILRNPLYDDVVNYAPTQADRDLICASDTTPPVNCASTPVVAIVDSRTRNLSKTYTKGVDFQLLYKMDLAGNAALNLGLNGTLILQYREALTLSTPLISRVNESGYPVDLRLRASASYSRGPLSTGFDVNYIGGSVKIDRLATSTVRTPVASYATVDFGLGYDWGEGAGILAGTSLRLNVNNIFDKDPPFADFTFGYDGTNFDPLGRVISLSLRKRW